MDREGQKRVSFYLDEDVKHDFHALCIRADLSMSDMLRGLVARLIRGDLIMLDSDSAREQKEG